MFGAGGKTEETSEAVLMFRKSSLSSFFGNSFLTQAVYKEADGGYRVCVEQGSGTEVNDSHTYRAEAASVDRIFEYIKENNLSQYEGRMEAGMMGGTVAVSFLSEERTVTVTGNNVPAPEAVVLFKVSELINECCTEEII